VIQLLIEDSDLPLERGKMRIKVLIDGSNLEEMKNKLNNVIDLLEDEYVEGIAGCLVFQIVPKDYRDVNTHAEELGATVEVLVHSVKPLIDIYTTHAEQQQNNVQQQY